MNSESDVLMADTGVSAEEISFDLQKCTICTFKIRIIDIKHIRLSNNGTETIALIIKACYSRTWGEHS